MRVCIEGNVGSGKSSVLAAVAVPAGVGVFPEPIEEWGDLLGLYYANPAEYALAFQLRVLLSFCSVPEHAVVERSPLASRHVFGQLLANDGTLTPAQWTLFKDYSQVLGWAPDGIVYIDTPANLCLQRVRERAREEERGVDLQFLRRVEFQYEVFLKYAQVPVVRVDGSQPADKVAADVDAALQRFFCAATPPPTV